MTETEKLYLLLGLAAGVAVVEFFWLMTALA
jgi:hypothetical protein